MKPIAMILVLAATLSAQASLQGRYELVSDTCYNSNEKVEPCDPQKRTVLKKLDVFLAATASPWNGSLLVQAKEKVDSEYAHITSPLGYYSNYGVIESNDEVSIYQDSASIRGPLFAPEAEQRQYEFHFTDDQMTIVVVVPDGNHGLFRKKLRAMVFQKQGLQSSTDFDESRR